MADAGYLLKEHTTIPGEGNLKTLLQNMKPELHDGVFVFCSMSEDKEIPAALQKLQVSPINLHRE